MTNITCNICGWVHVQVSRKHAEEESKSFNDYYQSLDKEVRERYWGKDRQAKISDYEFCSRCGTSYKNFRDSQPEDCPSGCTLGHPIIDRRE